MEACHVGAEDFMRWTIGSVRVTRILEMPPMVADLGTMIKAGKEDILQRLDWLYPDFADGDGNARAHFQAFVIEAGGMRILVDTCVGNDKERSDALFNKLDGPFLDSLERAGFPRETIDYVLCTHMHVDHIGWNTMLIDGVWVPTFSAARYIFAREEYEHMLSNEYGDAQAIMADSVRPVVDAGLAVFVESGFAVSPEVFLLPTPGHTPAHCSVMIASDGEEAMITGDFIHHPVQLAIPDADDNFCWNEPMARKTRRNILKSASDRGTLLLGSHFSGPTGIHVKADGEVWTIDRTRP